MTAETTIRWLGHSSFQVHTPAGLNLLFDPWIRKNPSTTVPLESLYEADLIFITHGHYDHFGDSLVLAQNSNARLVCNPEIGWYADKHGIKADIGSIRLDLGGSVYVNGLKISMVPATHLSALYGVEWETDKIFLPGGGACGYVVQIPDGPVIYFAGDTGLSAEMKVIAERFPIDIAILPIGDKFTMGPEDAAIATAWLEAPVVIPMHYNTYPAIAQDPIRFRELTAWANPSVEVVILNPGDTYSYARVLEVIEEK